MLDELLRGLSRILSTEKVYVVLLDAGRHELICVGSVSGRVQDFDGRDEGLLDFVRNTHRRVGTDTLQARAKPFTERLGEYSRLDYVPIVDADRPVGGLVLVDCPEGTSDREFDLLSLFLDGFGGPLRDSMKTETGDSVPSGKDSAQTLRRRTLFLVHELKSPLAAVQQLLTVLAEGIVGDLNEKQNELVQRALTRVRAQIEVLGDWLMGENASLGIPEERVHPVAVKSVLEQALEAVRSDVEMRGVQVTVPEFEPDVMVRADKELLTNAFRHVILNAVKFSPDNGLVVISSERGPEGIRIYVRDRGPGVASKDLPFVFDDFFHSKDPALRDKVGSGRGLSLARKVLEAHGGRIKVANRPEGGLETELFIPID